MRHRTKLFLIPFALLTLALVFDVTMGVRSTGGGRTERCGGGFWVPGGGSPAVLLADHRKARSCSDAEGRRVAQALGCGTGLLLAIGGRLSRGLMSLIVRSVAAVLALWLLAGAIIDGPIVPAVAAAVGVAMVAAHRGERNSA